MKRLLVVLTAVFGLALVAPEKSDAQVHVSVNIGPRWGYGYRAHYARPYYTYARPYPTGRVVHYNCGYHGCGAGYVVRPYPPRPVVVVRDRYHRGRGRW
jgi:hypothetical protein